VVYNPHITADSPGIVKYEFTVYVFICIHTHIGILCLRVYHGLSFLVV
jgi:hypothetical protein